MSYSLYKKYNIKLNYKEKMSSPFNLEKFCWESYKHNFRNTDIKHKNTYLKFEFYTNDNLCADLYKIFMKYGKKEIENKYDVAITTCSYDRKNNDYLQDDLPTYETLICWSKKNSKFIPII